MSTTMMDKPVETKEEKFKRLAKNRTDAALKRIDTLKNLVGPGYSSTEEERALVVQTLRQAVDELEHSFSGARRGPLTLNF